MMRRPVLKLVQCAFVIAAALACSQPAFACLSGGTEATIQAALDGTGVADLCSGATFTISQPIQMGNNTQIFTSGGGPNAVLRIADNVGWAAGDIKMIIDVVKNSLWGSGVTISNITLDGNRSNNVFDYHHILLRVGGSNNVIDSIVATHTLGYAAIDAADDANCSGLHITNSHVIDNGVHATAADRRVRIRCCSGRKHSTRSHRCVVRTPQMGANGKGDMDVTATARLDEVVLDR